MTTKGVGESHLRGRDRNERAFDVCTMTKLPLPENPPFFNGVRGVLHSHNHYMTNLATQSRDKASGPEAVGMRLTAGLSSAASVMLRMVMPHTIIVSAPLYLSLQLGAPSLPPGPTDYDQAG